MGKKSKMNGAPEQKAPEQKTSGNPEQKASGNPSFTFQDPPPTHILEGLSALAIGLGWIPSRASDRQIVLIPGPLALGPRGGDVALWIMKVAYEMSAASVKLAAAPPQPATPPAPAEN